MSATLDAIERRKLRSVARRYERDGYRVTVPGRGGGLPAFLEGFMPDLIAESEGDRVVIEVKRSDAVRGSNDLLEIAERVSREPGWRFELVALPSAGQAPTPGSVRMDVVEENAREAMSGGHAGLAYVIASGALDALLWDMAVRHGLRVTRMPFAQTVRDLVSLGIVSRDVSDSRERARAFLDALPRGDAERKVAPTVADVEDMLALARRLQGETNAATAD